MELKQQQISIARLCKWHDIGVLRKGELLGGIPPQAMLPGRVTVPVYPEDLNAMHEAEKLLTTDRLILNYRQHLIQIITGKAPIKGVRVWLDLRESHKLNTATAAQRAEAFLRTFDRWVPQSDQT